MKRDYSELLENAQKGLSEESKKQIFVGIDESSNRPEIFRLLDQLVTDGIVRQRQPLWNEQRMHKDGSVHYIVGGLSKLRSVGHLFGSQELGPPIPGISTKDADILDYLVTHFLGYGCVILLSEDTATGITGLRRPLREIFAPILVRPNNKMLSLAGIFKRGKTDIETYCASVDRLIRAGGFGAGYKELLI